MLKIKRYRLLVPDNRGMALLLVVSVVSFLTVVILQFSNRTRTHYFANRYHRESLLLAQMAESGVDMALAALQADRQNNDYDSLFDSWAQLDEKQLKESFDDGYIRVKVTDLTGLFQLSSLVSFVRAGEQSVQDEGPTPEMARLIFRRLLTSGDFQVEESGQVDEIIDSLIDWLDSDDNESDFGAEQSYYAALDPGYQIRNGRMLLPDEFRAVKGFSSALLSGNNDKQGLSEYITIYGDNGRINLNTAPASIIRALDDRISLENATALVEARKEEKMAEALKDSSWYRLVPGWPGDIVLDNRLLTTKSKYFHIDSRAYRQDRSRRVTVYVERDDKDSMKILYRKVL